MRRLMVTRADSGIKRMCAVSHPILKQCAQMWGADFMVLNHNCDVSRHYRIMALRELLRSYDVALSVDSDVLVMPTCPNPFEVVAKGAVGTVFEDVGSRRKKRRSVIAKVQAKFGDIGWKRGYMNTGFAVFPSDAAEVFKPIDGEMWDGWGYDDIHLMYQVRKADMPVQVLPYQWNHMTMFSEPWNGNADRFQSYVIHYAGVGVFEKGIKGNHEERRIKQMQRDRKAVYGY